MQTQICNAMHIAFSRYQMRFFPAIYSTTLSSSSQSSRNGMSPTSVNRGTIAHKGQEYSKGDPVRIMVKNHEGDHGGTNNCTLPRRLDL
jgi:hypothetical protein